MAVSAIVAMFLLMTSPIVWGWPTSLIETDGAALQTQRGRKQKVADYLNPPRNDLITACPASPSFPRLGCLSERLVSAHRNAATRHENPGVACALRRKNCGRASNWDAESLLFTQRRNLTIGVSLVPRHAAPVPPSSTTSVPLVDHDACCAPLGLIDSGHCDQSSLGRFALGLCA
jgi:hypothetical protein